MQQDELLARGIDLFNNRRYFECHEIWEELWTPERGPRRLFLQALIHFAVALYHRERQNPLGAVRQLRKGLTKLSGFLPACEGLDCARLHREGLLVLAALESAGPEDASPAPMYPLVHILPTGGNPISSFPS